jgi:hypothetical protein
MSEKNTRSKIMRYVWEFLKWIAAIVSLFILGVMLFTAIIYLLEQVLQLHATYCSSGLLGASNCMSP